MPLAVMDNSVESHFTINCFHAEYFGFAETARTDNISPNFVDDLVIKFLSINSSHQRSPSRGSITLVLPEFCPRTPVDIGLHSLSSGNGNCIQFRRVNDWTDHLKPFIPLRVLLKIGRTSIEICAAEPSATVLSRPLCEVISCSQGIAHPEYFGFLASSSLDSSLRFSLNNCSVTNCHVLRCANEIQVAGIMQAFKSAFNMISSSSSLHSSSSTSSSFFMPLFGVQPNAPQDGGGASISPIDRLNKLCREIQTKSFSEAHEILQRFIEVHHAHHHNSILRRVQEAGCETIQETNEIIVSCLLRLAEDKAPAPPPVSVPHTHTIPQSIDFLSTSSSIHPRCIPSTDASIHQMSSSFSAAPLQIASSTSPRLALGPPHKLAELNSESKGRVATQQQVHIQQHQQQLQQHELVQRGGNDNNVESVDRSRNQFPENSPMRTMFANVGNSMGKTQARKEKPTPDEKKVAKCRVNNTNNSNNHLRYHNHRQQQQQMLQTGSWRFGILNKVVNSSKAGLSSAHYARYLRDLGQTPAVKINYLWRKAIVDTMYLIKLNRGRSEEDDDEGGGRCDVTPKERQVRQMKADYDEITPCLVEVSKIWEEMLTAAAASKCNQSVDRDLIISAMRAGVPRNRRGDIWIFLMNQKLLEHPSSPSPCPQSPSSSSSSSQPPPAAAQSGTSYKDLLKMWTQHQHAILIDLGRTFPGHPYFSTQLGSGQISLFNILKAYSLFDSEVGYCQGISFVAGILLLHIPEEKSFEMLKFMMFDLDFRKQYCPDMVHLQIKLYQLSRLLHDLHRDLYDHFDRLEISPTLYAAPWFLTIFASQFPLGFVARVFDLIFLRGCEVVIKVAVVLLGNHKELIKQCDGFESVVEFLKTTLPEMSTIQMERIVNQVFDLDISKHLDAYKIEYHVLREEMLALKASTAAKVNNPIKPVSHVLNKGGSEYSGSIPTIIKDHHQDLMAKVQELTLVNEQLTEQVEQLQMRLTSLELSNNNNNDNNIDKSNTSDIIVIPQGDLLATQNVPPSSASNMPVAPSQFRDLLRYTATLETALQKAWPQLSEGLRSEFERFVFARPLWLENQLSTDSDAPRNGTDLGLRTFATSLSGVASSHPPNNLPVLNIRQSNASSGVPTPYCPLSPLSDGGVGCYLDREVEDFINLGIDIPPSRIILSDDDEMTRNLKIQILRNKDQGVSCRQRPSSNYY